MLQVDISNAFNSCDRARLLTQLYALPQLQTIFRLADFAYSQPSTLLLQGCDGQAIMSKQGVRQGDPLSPLLFCVYMREILQQVSEVSEVKVYGFFDDISLVGRPSQLMDALQRLKTALPAMSLHLNTSKSHFTYFHDRLTPLLEEVRHVLSDSNIEYHHEWAQAVGAIVGRDDDAIRRGVTSILSESGAHDAFLRRIQMSELSVQSALLLLRQSMVPAVHYLLRCIAPISIEEEARLFDDRVVNAAMDKLHLAGRDRSDNTVGILQRGLSDGGWGLIPASRTSPGAYLGSLAACHDEAAFEAFANNPVPVDSQLHSRLSDTLERLHRAAPSHAYATKDGQPLLPDTAGDFFIHCALLDPALTSTLQTKLNAKATSYLTGAAIEALRVRSTQGEKRPLAHWKAITAPAAWMWKATQPLGPRMKMSDVQYRLAARLNLDLVPFHDMESLPDACPMCRHRRTGLEVSLRDDPWHFLSCPALTSGEGYTRHNEIRDALHHVAMMAGAQTRREVEGLSEDSKIRPDLQILFPARMLLTDVVVAHPLTSSHIARRQSVAGLKQQEKRHKYASVAARIGAELLPFAVESCGGMAQDALKLIHAMAEEGEDTMRMWSSEQIARHSLCLTATAVQRGNAMMMLHGYTQCRRAKTDTGRERTGEGRYSDERRH